MTTSNLTVIRIDNLIGDAAPFPATATWADDGSTYFFYRGRASVDAQSVLGLGVEILDPTEDEIPDPPKDQTIAPLPRWIPRARAIADPSKTVLIPGPHLDGGGRMVEQKNSDFTDGVLRALPSDLLYRWDRIVGEIVGQQFREITADRMRLIVDRHVRLAKWAKKRTAFRPCTKDLAGLVTAAATSGTVRELRMLTRYPVYGPGFLRAVPGWNPATGILYQEPEDLRDLEPGEPDTLALFDLMADFPFRDPLSDRMNLIGLMLTILLRPCFPTVPIHLVQSSIERTGKGMLISSILGSLVGGHIPSVQVGEREEEREKRFTTLILEGATLVHLDNLPGSSVLDSASLAALATAPVWKGRVLGASSMPTLPNTLTLVASANNLRTSSEIAKRIVPIWLEPATSSPETRDNFIHPDIHAYARSMRRTTLASLLGMVEAWIAAGKPRGSVRLGGFEDWAATIGGILETQGIDCWMAKRAEWASEADEWGRHVDALVEAWAAELPRIASARDLLNLAERLDLFPDVLSRPEGKARETMFGNRVMKRLINRPVLAYKITKDRSRTSLYILTGGESTDAPSIQF